MHFQHLIARITTANSQVHFQHLPQTAASNLQVHFKHLHEQPLQIYRYIFSTCTNSCCKFTGTFSALARTAAANLQVHFQHLHEQPLQIHWCILMSACHDVIWWLRCYLCNNIKNWVRTRYTIYQLHSYIECTSWH